MKFKQAIKDSWKNFWKLGLTAGVIGYGVQWIITKFRIAPLVAGNKIITVTASTLPLQVDLREQINQGIAPQFGKYLLELISGFAKIDVLAFIYFILGSLAFFFVGRIFYNLLGDKIILWAKDAMRKKVQAIILYSMITGLIVTLILSGITAMMTISLAVIMYYLMLALVISILMRFFKPFAKGVSQ